MKATPLEYSHSVKRKSDQDLLMLRDDFKLREELDPLDREYLQIIEAEIHRRGLETQVTLGQKLDRKAIISEQIKKGEYPEELNLTFGKDIVTVGFVPATGIFTLQSETYPGIAGKGKLGMPIGHEHYFNELMNMIAKADMVNWKAAKPQMERKEPKPPKEIPQEKLRSTLVPYVEAARVKPLSEFFGPAKAETGADRRMKIAKEFQDRADAITTKIYAEIYSFKPLGRMTELGEALGGEPSKGKAVTTPLGTFVFAKNRVPDSQAIERWRIQHAESERLSKGSARYSVISFKPQPNTVTGNFRVVEEGRYFREQGLLSPEEDQHLRELEQFWASHLDLDREKGWGVYRESGKIELPTPIESPPSSFENWVVTMQTKEQKKHFKSQGVTTEEEAKRLADQWQNDLLRSGKDRWYEVTVKAPGGLATEEYEMLTKIRGIQSSPSNPTQMASEDMLIEIFRTRWSNEKIRETLASLVRKGEIYSPRPDHFRSTLDFELSDRVFGEMRSVIRATPGKDFDICQAETTFVAEIGQCGEKNGKAVGRLLAHPVESSEMKDLSTAKFEVACVAEPDNMTIRCFDPDTGKLIKEAK